MHYLMDLDNTLLDTYHIDEAGRLHFHWSMDFEKDFGVSSAVLHELFDGPFLIALQRTKNLERFIAPFLKKHKIDISVEDFLEYWLSRDMRVNTEVWDWIKLEKSKGHSFHIASNQPHIRMDYLLENLIEWHDVFEWVFTSARLGVSKSDPSFFRYAKNYLKVPFNQMCLIDDSMENIAVAKSLGMNGILFQGVENLKDQTK